MKKIEKDLFSTLETIGKNDKKVTAEDKLFLYQLSEWVIKYFGNVNVALRLSIMGMKVGKL